MRTNIKEQDIKLIEFIGNGIWVVRWDIQPSSNPDYVWECEEVHFNHIPEIIDIQNVITEWFNKQTDIRIKHSFNWNGKNVYLSDENKFNFKAIIDEAARVETAIHIWDESNPELSGKDYIESIGEDENGNSITVQIPTGRPQSLLPITLKLGIDNSYNSFYTFTELSELQEFFNLGVQHLITAYGIGWGQIASFDYAPYVKALEEL